MPGNHVYVFAPVATSVTGCPKHITLLSGVEVIAGKGRIFALTVFELEQPLAVPVTV